MPSEIVLHVLNAFAFNHDGSRAVERDEWLQEPVGRRFDSMEQINSFATLRHPKAVCIKAQIPKDMKHLCPSNS